MGICESSDEIPHQILSMPKDKRQLIFSVLYCNSWGGADQAHFVQQLLETVYPNSKVRVSPTAPRSTVLVIDENQKTLYDSEADGYVFNPSA